MFVHRDDITLLNTENLYQLYTKNLAAILLLTILLS